MFLNLMLELSNSALFTVTTFLAATIEKKNPILQLALSISALFTVTAFLVRTLDRKSRSKLQSLLTNINTKHMGMGFYLANKATTRF